MTREKTIKVKAIREWDHLTPSIVHMPLYGYLCLCNLISYLIPIGYRPTVQAKCLDIWLHLSLWRGISRSWCLERWRCSRVNFVVVSIHLLLFLLECMFDAKICDLSFWSVERFIWEVWRCLDFKAFHLNVLSVYEKKSIYFCVLRFFVGLLCAFVL